MKHHLAPWQRHLALLLAGLLPTSSIASSHMDAPLITLDPAANTTDVYAFVTSRTVGTVTNKYLTVALAVYPHQEPGVGPNKYNFDDTVLYELHVATGDDLAAGRPSVSYQFEFTTSYKTSATILQSYLGVVQNVDDAAQNLTQRYTVTKRESHGKKRTTVLGQGIVPPNNQGHATPYYNQGDNGEMAARNGVADAADLDRYTRQGIASLSGGHRAFAGQRDDGFYADVQSIFDLLRLRSPGRDSQGGFNVHLIALEIPVSEVGGDRQVAGVYATTSRREVKLLRGETPKKHETAEEFAARVKRSGPMHSGKWIQVARQGNPLFNEGLVALEDKDVYSRTTPETDALLFRKYAEAPELNKLINLLVFGGAMIAPETNRTDIAGIYIPDLIKVDLSTGPAHLAGNGPSHPTNPDDAGFSRMSIFGNDVLVSLIQPGFGGGIVPGGWPNGRRFGDDVVDIAVSALLSDLRGPLVIRVADGVDGVSANDQGYNKVFPYEGTPQNGRTHAHP